MTLQKIVWKTLTIITLLFIWALPMAQATQASIDGCLRIKLLDFAGEPISGVRLHAWIPGNTRMLASDTTDSAGIAVLEMAEGTYFVGGDVSTLKSREKFLVQALPHTRYYFLSALTALKAGNEPVVFKIEPTQYIDVTSHNDRSLPMLMIEQEVDQRRQIIDADPYAKTIRLFVPMRQIYRIGEYEKEEVFALPSVYTSPGLLMFISAQ